MKKRPTKKLKRKGNRIPQGYVAFVDVLGSRKRINSLFNSSNTLEKVLKDPFLQAFNEARKLAKRPILPTSKHEAPFIAAVSDSAILYAPSTFAGLKFIVEAVWLLTHKLLAHGVLLRGAITHGRVVRLEDTKTDIIGPAFNEVVELEKSAVYPRVILSPTAAKKVFAAPETDAPFFRRHLRFSPDGLIHVRPAGSIGYKENGQKVTVSSGDVIEPRRDAVMKALRDNTLTEKERAKLIWLSNELESCDQSNETSFEEFEPGVYPLVRRRSQRQ